MERVGLLNTVGMLALRLLCPASSTAAALDVLTGHPGATHVVLLRGAAVQPAGDVVLADLAREAASEIVDALRSLPEGSICSYALENVDTSLSSYADEAERAAPGLGVDAIVWEEVQARTDEDATLSGSFVALLVLATLLAAIGLLLDSPVLIVGAMVIGPDFGPLAGLTVALVQRRWTLARQSFGALLLAFPVASLAALVLTALVRLIAGLPPAYAGEQRPLTSFVSRPDGYALLVALLAGVAGVVSLTSGKSAALVGVAVSVTTVPAAADIGVSAAAGRWGECAGAGAQLAINVVALIFAGAATLGARRALSGASNRRRVGRMSR